MRNIGSFGRLLIYVLAGIVGASIAIIQTYAWSLRPTPTKPIPPGTAYIVPQVVFQETVTLEDKDDGEDTLIAQVVMAEAGNQPFVGKVAVAMVILNRMDMYEQTASDVIYAENQFASPAKICSEECVKAVEFAKENRELFPENLIYFRTKYFHSYGEPYAQIGDHFFSCEVADND